jgi:hypothetical protein
VEVGRGAGGGFANGVERDAHGAAKLAGGGDGVKARWTRRWHPAS